MIKKLFFPVTIVMLIAVAHSCRTAKKINTAIAPKDSTAVNINQSVNDSIQFVNAVKGNMRNNFIDTKTFSAKIKVEIEDAQGKQPDVTAVVRMIRDSAMWVSLTATFLNIEVYRALITKDSVILMNKQKKEVQYRSLEYLQDVTSIPFDFSTLENLLLGNPIFFDSSNVSFRKRENFIMASTVTEQFKNLLTLSLDRCLLTHSKLDDADIYRNRTADITYDNYEQLDGRWFSTNRQLIVSEKNKLDIRMEFKQVEFNKVLSVSFNIPRNYKRK
ncbi:MAG: DUF4292 domain-containing protein [Ferruginibacter sp.]